MTESVTFHGDVAGGHLPDHTRRLIADMIAKFEGKRITVTIAKYIKLRTSNQNRFMHGPFFKAMRAAHAEGGEKLSTDEVKELFKENYGIRQTIRGIDGKEKEVLKSTRQYSTTECEECMEKARAEYAEYNHYLPFPNEHRDNKIIPSTKEDSHA